jgi:hypothetical protein
VPPTPWFGVLQGSGRYLAQEANAGITVLTLELAWDKYEPGRDSFDMSYIAAQKAKLRAFCDAGFSVVLAPGLNHPPDWVFALDQNTYYVNQYGDRYAPDRPGSKVANGVFDPAVRATQEAYVARLRADLCDCFYAIRVGGGQDGEVMYPSSDYNGHPNSFWGYDANAQASSPVPHWLPGTASREDARQFWSYYVERLVDYQNWLVKTFRGHFTAWMELLYPDSGLRPGQAAYAIDNLLAGNTPAQERGLLSVGTDFEALVNGLRDRHVIVYSTDMEEAGQGTAPLTESSIRYLQGLASARHLPVAGENSGDGQPAHVMQLCVQRLQSMSLVGMMWLAEPALVDETGSSASLTDYAHLISSSTGSRPTVRPS